MVTLGSRRIHVVFADSRGGGLQDLTDDLSRNTNGEHLEITEYKGATLEILIDSAEKYLCNHLFDVIYIAGGANNITSKNKLTSQIYYEWGPGPQLSDHLISILLNAEARFKKYFPASKVVFCPLVGSDLSGVVNAHPVSLQDQSAVDVAVWNFNSEVFRISNERNTYCPALQQLVHRFLKGKKRVYYHHLHDGLHPSDYLKTKWAKQFLNAVAHN